MRREGISAMSFLSDAAEYLFFPSAGRCPYCGDENGNGAVCAKCSRELEGLLIRDAGSSGISKYAHAGIARSMVLRLKFEGRTNLARVIARELADLVPGDVDIITFVPLHPLRQRARGYNQSELIAKELAGILDIPCRCLLIRIKNTPKQSTRQSVFEREHNLRNAFAPAFGQSASGKNILLVDDVITTGATVRECSKQLLKSKPASVRAISFTAAR